MRFAMFAVYHALNTPLECALYTSLLNGKTPPKDSWIEVIETMTLKSLLEKKNLKLIE